MVGVKTLRKQLSKFVEASGKSFEAKNLTEFVTTTKPGGDGGYDAPIVFVGYESKRRIRLGRLQDCRSSRKSGASLL